jgi:amino acid transporter
MTTLPAAGREPAPSRLHAHVLGFPALLGQSVALISPTMTAVLIIPLAFSNAGQGTWLAYAFGTVMLGFVVANLNQFSRRSATAGSMYVYTARGLGPGAGVFSGWTLIWSYFFIATAGLTGFAIFAGQLLSSLGLHSTVPPVIFFCLSAAVCWYVAAKDIRLSSILTLALEGVSVALILCLAGVVLFKHGFHVDHSQVTLKGVGFHGMSLAVVACIFSLVGFESATALGGEARNPLRNVPKAVWWSLGIAGAFFVLMSYVEVSGTAGYHGSLANVSAPLNLISQLYGVTFFKIPLSIAAMISFFSLSLSCINAGSRIMYPMGQHGLLPASVGTAHRQHGTPHLAITVYTAMILVDTCILEVFTNPLTIFNDAGTLAAFGFLLAYFLCTVAAPAYLRKLGELKARHVVVAVLSFLFLLVPTEGSIYPVPAWPISLFPYLFLGWIALGAIWLLALRRKRRTILAEIEADLEATRAAHEGRIPAPEPTVAAPPAVAVPLS